MKTMCSLVCTMTSCYKQCWLVQTTGLTSRLGFKWRAHKFYRCQRCVQAGGRATIEQAHGHLLPAGLTIPTLAQRSETIRKHLGFTVDCNRAGVSSLGGVHSRAHALGRVLRVNAEIHVDVRLQQPPDKEARISGSMDM